MVTVELIYTTGIEYREIPSKWEDISLKKYIEIRKLSENTIGSLLEHYSTPATVQTLEVFKFFKIPFEPTIPEGYSINIGKESWGKLERARIEITKLEEENPDFITMYLKLIEIYTTFADVNCVEGIGLGKYIFESITMFFDNFKELNERDEDAASEIAGTEDLDAMGFFFTLDELAEGKVWMHDVILALPARQIYTKLLKDKRKAKFQKAYTQAYKMLNDTPSTR